MAVLLALATPAAPAGEVDTLRQALQKRQLEQRQLERRLEDSERRIGELAREIRRLEGELAELKARRSEVDRRLRAVGEARDRHRAHLAAALRSLYAQGRDTGLRLWLGESDPAVIGRTRTYLTYLTRARVRHMQAVREAEAELRELQATLTATQKALEARHRRLQAQQERLRSAQAERRQILAALQRRNERDAARLQRLLADQKRLQGLVDGLERGVRPPRGADGRWRRGSLVWPVQGKVVARYGAPRAADGRLRWQGWVIRAPEGTPVRAVDEGVVRYAGWMRGYGNLIIIDHGRQRLSLYGFNQALLKGVGERVRAGEAVALVGASGGRDRPALYFELRQRGKPLDPARWLAKR